MHFITPASILLLLAYKRTKLYTAISISQFRTNDPSLDHFPPSVCSYMQANSCKSISTIFSKIFQFHMQYETELVATSLYSSCIASLKVELTTYASISEILCARQSEKYISSISEVLAIYKYSLRKSFSSSAAAHLHLIN